jgi:hypothetical protein
MSVLGQKRTTDLRTKFDRCPLWSKSGQTPARPECPLSANRDDEDRGRIEEKQNVIWPNGKNMIGVAYL